MRNRGPGQWREWHYSNLTVPLYMPDPKEKPAEGTKPINEVAHLTMRAMTQKQQMPKLTDAINALVAAPDSPGGRISEQRFRDTLKDTAQSVLSAEELEVIFPSPPPEEEIKTKRRGSKSTRRPSKEAAAPEADKE
mmetsp:Transcript_39324/g.69181  ORF Transcript_39324/g.69181 Transcript_39324/m.69181 type:complete len:136 (-) Transcript_39324:97-504(-)